MFVAWLLSGKNMTDFKLDEWEFHNNFVFEGSFEFE